MINTGVNEGSAKIYQFPVGGRAAFGGRRYGAGGPTLPSRPSISPIAAAAGTTLPPSGNLSWA